MNTRQMTLEQIRTAGLEALNGALGPVGMIRFLQQFERGRGDYTAERHGWLDGISVEQIAREAARIRRRTRLSVEKTR